MLLFFFILSVFVLLFAYFNFNTRRFWKILSEIKSIEQKTLINKVLLRTKTVGLTFDNNTYDCMLVLLKDGFVIASNSEDAAFMQYWYVHKSDKNKLRKVISKGKIKSLEYDKKNAVVHLTGNLLMWSLFYFSYSPIIHRIELTEGAEAFELWYNNTFGL